MVQETPATAFVDDRSGMGPVRLCLGFAGCTYNILCMNMYMHVWMHGCGYIGMYRDVCVGGGIRVCMGV